MPLNFDRPIQTADGRPVDVLAVDLNSDTPVAVAITNPDGSQVVEQYTIDGIEVPSGAPGDVLVNVAQLGTSYVNYYGGGRCDTFGTRQVADDNADPGRIATIVIGWTDGVVTSTALV